MRVQISCSVARRRFCRALSCAYLLLLAPVLSAQQAKASVPPAPVANFIDVAEKAGVTLGNWSTGATWGDYDGDGSFDVAFWRPSTQTWTIRPSSNPTQPLTIVSGVAGSLPAYGPNTVEIFNEAQPH